MQRRAQKLIRLTCSFGQTVSPGSQASCAATPYIGKAAAAQFSTATHALHAVHRAVFRRTDSWWPCLAVGGLAASLVAYNLETAPVTGRHQFIFHKFKSPPDSTMQSSPAMPQAVRTRPPCNQGLLFTELSDQGDEILRICYQRIAAAVAVLAETDPALQRHLASIPEKIELSHHTHDIMGGCLHYRARQTGVLCHLTAMKRLQLLSLQCQLSSCFRVRLWMSSQPA